MLILANAEPVRAWAVTTREDGRLDPTQLCAREDLAQQLAEAYRQQGRTPRVVEVWVALKEVAA